MPKELRDKIAKLPPDQQKFIYLRQLKQIQLIKDQQVKEQQLKSKSMQSSKVVAERQDKLVKEQQVAMMLGMGKPGGPSSLSRSASPVVTATVASEQHKSNFANMKLASATPPPGPSEGPRKRKGKAKDTGGGGGEVE